VCSDVLHRKADEVKMPEIIGKFPAIHSCSPEATARIGRALSRGVFPGLLILLCGDLGAGKTLLAQSIGAELGVRAIKSPTFALESIYQMEGGGFSMIHSDLYRLDAVSGSWHDGRSTQNSEVAMLLDERLSEGCLVLVEWGERWKDPPKIDRWDIRIFQDAGNHRELELSAFGEKALGALAGAYGEMLELAALTGDAPVE
jgi:tRNA threonylcarbamoyladenosine biosynthesis protein TsaE